MCGYFRTSYRAIQIDMVPSVDLGGSSKYSNENFEY